MPMMDTPKENFRIKEKVNDKSTGDTESDYHPLKANGLDGANAVVVATIDPTVNDGASCSADGKEEDEIITLDSYTKYSQEEIRAQMIKTVVEDPMMILVFADPDLQSLIRMANRSFTVPNIEEVLKERFQKLREKLVDKISEETHSSIDLCLFPLTINDEEYVLAELVSIDTNGRLSNYLMDCFPLDEVSTSATSVKIQKKLAEFKIESKIGEILVWDLKFRKLRSNISTNIALGSSGRRNGGENPTNISKKLEQLASELKEMKQTFQNNKPECAKIANNFFKENNAEMDRLEHSVVKLQTVTSEAFKIIENFETKEEISVYCKHVIPDYPLNLLRFTKMTNLTEVVTEILASLQKSTEKPVKKFKPDSLDAHSDRKQNLLSKLVECESSMHLANDLCERFSNLSDRLLAKGGPSPNAKPFLEVAARATTTVDVPQHLWIMVPFLRVWKKVLDE